MEAAALYAYAEARHPDQAEVYSALGLNAREIEIIGGLLRGLGGLLGGLLIGFGGTVHDHGREQLQISILAEQQAKVALMSRTEEALSDVRADVARWDSIRVAWLGEYERQLTKAPAFEDETAPAQQQRFEEALTGREAALLAFMDDRSRTQELWTGFDPHFRQPNHRFEVDAGEIARFTGRIDTLAYVQQMRDMKAQGLLLHVKQLQHLRYQIVLETARRASAYGDELGSEARRRALYDRLLPEKDRAPREKCSEV